MRTSNSFSCLNITLFFYVILFFYIIIILTDSRWSTLCNVHISCCLMSCGSLFFHNNKFSTSSCLLYLKLIPYHILNQCQHPFLTFNCIFRNHIIGNPYPTIFWSLRSLLTSSFLFSNFWCASMASDKWYFQSVLLTLCAWNPFIPWLLPLIQDKTWQRIMGRLNPLENLKERREVSLFIIWIERKGWMKIKVND